MRWTKGKPAERAPCGVWLLTAKRWSDGVTVEYQVAKREPGAWDANYDPPRPTYRWLLRGRIEIDTPDRYWELPK